MQYAITGCLGYLGSHIVERLTLQGHTVFGLQRRSDPQDQFKQVCQKYNLKPNLALVKFIPCDITKPTWNLPKEFLQVKLDKLVHAAGDISILKSAQGMKPTNIDPLDFFSAINAQTIVHISTLAIFVSSNWEKGICTPTSEYTNLKWTTGYAESKALAEVKIKEMGDDRIGIVRPSQITSKVMPDGDMYNLFCISMKNIQCRPEITPMEEINLVDIQHVIDDILNCQGGEIIHSFGRNHSLADIVSQYPKISNDEFQKRIKVFPRFTQTLIKNTFIRPVKTHKNIDIMLSTGVTFQQGT